MDAGALLDVLAPRQYERRQIRDVRIDRDTFRSRLLGRDGSQTPPNVVTDPQVLALRA
ncbi:MAG: hypothetical protein WKF47_03790 [Geodermatophilaceae bacterium]